MFRTWALGFLLVLIVSIPGLAWADGKLTEDQFTQEFASAVKNKVPGANVEIVGKLTVRVKFKEREPYTAMLDNAYAKYLSDNLPLQEALGPYVDSVLNSGDFQTEYGAPIKPIIRPVFSLGEYGVLPSGDPKATLASISFSGNLAIYFVHDGSKKITYITQQELADRHETVHDLFLESVKSLNGDLPDYKFEQAGVFTMVAGDEFTSSLVLLDNFWTKPPVALNGDPVVFMVSRDALIITGSENRDEIRAIAPNMKEIVAHSAYSISSEPLVRRKGVWEAYTP